MVVVGGDLDREGYLHLRDVIDPSLVTPELIEHISSTPPNPADGYSGILRPQHTPATVEIERQTIEAILKAHPGLDAVTQPRTQDPVQLVPGRPLIAIKVGPNADKKKTGGLNWHVDAYSYFLRGDHHQWYVAYTPILKENERDSNLAVIPYSVLQKVDPRAYEKLKGRGAVDFIKMQKGWPKGLEIAQRLAPEEDCQMGDWIGIDKVDDDCSIFKLAFNPEEHMVVPQLRNLDVLVFRADLIHRTADTKCNRISIKSDLVPNTDLGYFGYLHRWYFKSFKVACWNLAMRRKPYPWRAYFWGWLVRARFCLRTCGTSTRLRQHAPSCLPLAGQSSASGRVTVCVILSLQREYWRAPRGTCRTLKKWYGLRPPRSCAAAARTGPGSGRSQPEAREARRASKKRRDIAEFSGSATTQR